MERSFLRKSGVSLEQLRCFVCVYETLNITGAAQRLAKTQSAVTITLQKFEETIGVEVFNRRLGKNLVRADGAENIYIKAVDILKRVNSLHLPTDRVIRVGIPDDLSTNKMLQINSYFNEFYNDSTVSLIVDKNENHARNYVNGNLDFYLHKKLKVNSESSEVNGGRYLYTSKLIWVNNKRVNLELLEYLPLVSFHEGCIPSVCLEHALAMLKIPYKIAYKSFSWYQNIEAIKSGLGVGIILDTMYDDELTILGAKEGFPMLWDIDIYLIGQQDISTNELADGLKIIFS
ncbi:DNA-binding transcriptional LysR family regulator [Marinomonas alcarazii]|uniref:DNA-binding transcriptional LysR family regulator n=1 Tax=Marinomonas alcarazii TaxID=491949 RepID=A0A318V109_9GAMM|nr:LysR family transcriptional regulator [Marinomonas alcarazii]PYF82304.1 DNA-binding transcriptional LysR family regulator [Marinomonas alcarazii]